MTVSAGDFVTTLLRAVGVAIIFYCGLPRYARKDIKAIKYFQVELV